MEVGDETVDRGLVMGWVETELSCSQFGASGPAMEAGRAMLRCGIYWP